MPAGQLLDNANPELQIRKCPAELGAKRGTAFTMEAEVGIEPAYADLQSAA